MATIGKWSGGVVSSLAPITGYTGPNGMFPTEDRNDGSVYTFTSSTSTLTLPSSDLADGYMMIAATEFENSGATGRLSIAARFWQSGGTGNFVTSEVSGYTRDASEDRAYIRAWAFVDNPSTSSTYQFLWRRDSDASNASDGPVRSEFIVIPFFYANHGLYETTSTGLYGGTTPNKVTGFSTINQSDTNSIEISSDSVTIKGDNKKYFIMGGSFGDHGSSAGTTQRWGGLYTSSAMVRDTMACAHGESAASEYCGGSFMTLVETSTTNITYDLRKYRGDGTANQQGGGDIDAATGTSHRYTLAVLELNDSAEGFHSVDGTGGNNFATTGPIDVPIARTGDITFNDSASFTRANDTTFNSEQAMDALIGANISCANYDVTAGANQWSAYAEFTVNGTEQSDTFHGNNMKGYNATAANYGWSANPYSVLGLSSGDDIGVSVTELSGTEGGSGNIASPADWTGFWGLNLDTLEASTSVNGTVTYTQAADTTSSSVDVDIDGTVTYTQAADTTSSAGEVDIVGTTSYTQDDVTGTRTGEVDIDGDTNLTAADDTVSSAGDVDIVSTASIAAADDTASSSGEVDIDGTA